MTIIDLAIGNERIDHADVRSMRESVRETAEVWAI